MEDERDSGDIPRSTGSDPSGSRSGFELSAKLRTRMEKLEKWRISPSSIKAPEDARQFHGGHATVSKAFLVGNHSWNIQRSREVLRLCRQSPNSDDHIRGAADHRRDAEGELDDEEKDDEEEYGFNRNSYWRGWFVAVKKSRIGDNKDLERLLGLALRETEFLVRLSHPNIVKLKGFVEDLSKDIIWLVFPWEDNGNLKDFVASRDWEIPERISLINDVAGGLEYLHNREPPVCHGDLKSFNVLVTSERRAVITDFGSARRLTEHDLDGQPGLVQNQQQPVQAKFSTLSKTITLTGNIYTLRWAAPELLNDDQMSLWSDIWALGWIAYEVLTNSIPFQDVPADAVVIERVINGDLPSINEHARVALFEKLCSLMTMCWNTNPRERPTAKNYLDTICDMPMVAPDTTYKPDSTFSHTSSARALMERGKKERMFGDPAMAFACFTEAHRIYTSIGDRKAEADALDSLAVLHLNREEYNEAIAHYSEEVQIRTDLDDRQGRADALFDLAEVHWLQTKYSAAIALYSEVLQIRTDIDRRGQAAALSSLTQVHQLREEYSEAITLDSEALQVRPDIGDRRGQASALSSLAQVHQLRKEYSEAIKLYSKALQIRPDIGDKRDRADDLWRLAEVHRLREEYSEAITLYSEALQIRPNIGDRRGQASALSSLAQVHQLREEYSEAVELYSEALQIRTDLNDRRGRADALWGLADVHRLRNECSEAVGLYSEALQIHNDLGGWRRRADALRGLAGGHRRRDDYSGAAGLSSEALQSHIDLGDMRGRADTLWGLAEVHRLRNEYSEAVELYSVALKIRTDIGDRRGRADALWGVADVLRRRDGRYFEAVGLYSEALQIRTTLRYRQVIASVLRYVGGPRSNSARRTARTSTQR